MTHRLRTSRASQPVALILFFLVGGFAFPGRLSAHEHCLQGGPSKPPVFHEGERIEDAARRLLNSPDPQDQAWAAYFIGAHRFEQFTSDLRRLLVPVSENETWQLSYLRLAVLDNLIRLRAALPAAELMPLFEHYPDTVIILLAHAPDENREALLSLFVQLKDGNRWLAVGNLLAEAKTPGFAPLLLRDLTITALVVVSEKGTVGVGGGVGGGCVADGFHHVPASFPPIGKYKLVRRPSRGAIFLARGKSPISYERVVVSGNCQRPFGRSFTTVDGNRKRAEYLGAMLGINLRELNFRINPHFGIAWATPEEHKTVLARIRRQIKDSFGRVVEQLIEANLLTRSEAEGLTPNFSITVRDERRDKTIPLPPE